MVDARARLVDGCNHGYRMRLIFADFSQHFGDLRGADRVETTRGFIEDENVWVPNQLEADADAPHLSAGDSSVGMRANTRVRNARKAELLDDLVDASQSIV